MPTLPILVRPKAKTILIYAPLGVLLILAALLVLKGFSPPWRGETLKKPAITPIPTPTPTPKPIPHGKQTFSVSSGKKTGPQFRTGTIDPYDPARSGKQTVSVFVRDTVPVVSVMSTLKLDNGQKMESDMKLVEGTATDGRWETTWQVVYPYFYTYNLIFIAKDGNDASQVELTLR